MIKDSKMVFEDIVASAIENKFPNINHFFYSFCFYPFYETAALIIKFQKTTRVYFYLFNVLSKPFPFFFQLHQNVTLVCYPAGNTTGIKPIVTHPITNVIKASTALMAPTKTTVVSKNYRTDFIIPW